MSIREQIAALMDTPSEAATMRSLTMETGAAVRGLRSRERSPTRTTMEIDIGTPVREIFEGSPLDDRDDRGRIREEVMRDPEKIYEEISRIMRVVERLKTTVEAHERRQEFIDGLYEEMDKLGLQIAGLSPRGSNNSRIEAIEERVSTCERTRITEERAVDIAHMCVAGSRVAQDDFENEQSERLNKVVGDIEMLARKLDTVRREGKAEIGERVKEATTDIAARIIRSASSKAATRAHQIGELGESVKIVASRVDGIQDTASRCKSDCTKMHQLFSDLHRSIGDKVSREESKDESSRVDSNLQDLRDQLREVGERLKACEREARKSGDPGPGTMVNIDTEARERITRECGGITRVVKLLATRVNEKDELVRKEIGRASSDIERLRETTKKLTEVVTKARDEASNGTKLAERAIRVATEVERSASTRADRLTQEFTGVKKVVQDSIDDIKQRLERQGVPEATKARSTVASGSADRLVARRLSDLETRVGNNEAASNRQGEAQEMPLPRLEARSATWGTERWLIISRTTREGEMRALKFLDQEGCSRRR